jgi:hypothetical protein
MTLKSWREAKRSPYFFLRVQATQRMQRYMTVTAVLALVLLGTTAYSWRAPSDDVMRVAILSRAKPSPKAAVPASSDGPLVIDASPAVVTVNLSPDAAAPLVGVPGETVAAGTLPATYDTLEPTAELLPDTTLGEITFSPDITADYEPIDAQDRYVEGFFTVYATFSYDQMVDGMVWSWVWRQNGQVIDGGNQVWSYGPDGPGYIYLRPEEGFQPGDYSLEIWINDQRFAQAGFFVSEGIAASN